MATLIKDSKKEKFIDSLDFEEKNLLTRRDILVFLSKLFCTMGISVKSEGTLSFYGGNTDQFSETKRDTFTFDINYFGTIKTVSIGVDNLEDTSKHPTIISTTAIVERVYYEAMDEDEQMIF